METIPELIWFSFDVFRCCFQNMTAREQHFKNILRIYISKWLYYWFPGPESFLRSNSSRCRSDSVLQCPPPIFSKREWDSCLLHFKSSNYFSQRFPSLNASPVLYATETFRFWKYVISDIFLTFIGHQRHFCYSLHKNTEKLVCRT